MSLSLAPKVAAHTSHEYKPKKSFSVTTDRSGTELDGRRLVEQLTHFFGCILPWGVCITKKHCGHTSQTTSFLHSTLCWPPSVLFIVPVDGVDTDSALFLTLTVIGDVMTGDLLSELVGFGLLFVFAALLSV